MAKRTQFNDPSSRTGIFEGDLRYGRRAGNELQKHNDFASGRYEIAEDGTLIDTGQVKNAPAVPLVLVQPRDPEVWANKVKPPKVKNNPPQLEDQMMMLLAKRTGGLACNVSSLKLGKTVIR